jgi:hypothetical protein
MKTLVLAALFSLFAGNPTGGGTTVYISTGKYAYAYHAKETCPALKKCREEKHVKAISLEEAKNMGRKPCGKCY